MGSLHAALRAVMRRLGAALTLGEIVQIVVDEAVGHTRAFGAYLERAGAAEPGREVEILAGSGRGVPPTGTRAPYPGSLTQAILDSGEAELITEVGAIGESMAPYLARSCGGCTGLIVPLLSEGEVLGALVLLRSPEQDPFQPGEVELARLLGDAASAAMRRVLLVEERTAALERQRFLSDASRVLASSLDHGETLARVARLAVPEVADWCAVDILEGGRVHRVAVAHTDPERVRLAEELGRRHPASAEAARGVGKVIRTGEPELHAEVTERQLRDGAEDGEHYRLLAGIGIRSAMIVPMVARGRVLGALTFAAGRSGRRYGADDLAFAEQLAQRAAAAVENARLYREAEEARAEAERRAREEAALRRAAEAVSAAFTVQDVVRQIAHSALEATEADGAFVKRLEILTGELEVVAVAGDSVPDLGLRLPYEGSVTQRVIERTAPEVVPEISRSELSLLDGLPERCGGCSAVVVPLLDAGQPIGSLVLLRGPEQRRFHPDEIQRAFAFGNLAALAFRKMHLLEDSERRRAELERVTESRGRLMRGFSHDLKNPLNAADGFAQLLEDEILGPLTPRQVDGTGRIRRLIGASVRLIDDLLELARAESGDIDLRRTATDVRETAREMVESFRPQAEAKGLVVEAELPETFPVIESDNDRIRQILGNLLSNAVKYTRRGVVTLRVGLRPRQGATGAPPHPESPPPEGPPLQGTREGIPFEWITVDVADTGPGIAPEQRELLFQEFVRGDHGIETGAGVGLAIAQRVANALGGDITVESEVGQGSTFTLWLPTRTEL